MLKPKYYTSKDNEFVIENYNKAHTFSSFFPGISGLFGIPMWVFYANRGQCITSFGVNDKDGAILEFLSASKAYRTVSLNGFRTLLKVDGKFYEPFSEMSQNKNEMRITPHDLTLSEVNTALKIRTEVNYFTLPNENFPALVRTLKVSNLSNVKRKVEVVDGVPLIIPFGFANTLLKNISRTIEAWSIVENLENNAPFFKLKITPADISETKFIKKGHFYLSFSEHGEKCSMPEIIVNPKTVFGEITSLEYPANFMDEKTFKLPKVQMTECFIPSALSYERFDLGKKDSFELFSIVGQMDSVESLNRAKKRITNKKFISAKAGENRAIIEEITSKVSCKCCSKDFELYAKQSFLDNIMRGGMPLTCDDHVLHVYYRKHGDMERDYNDFKLNPTYFSQGSGNYRDINQNRRNDVFFNPDVGDSNIIKFINLIQLDGFNPLVVLGSKYFIRTREAAAKTVKKHIKNASDDLIDKLTKPFVLGEILMGIKQDGIKMDEFINDLMETAENVEEAVHGEGFWTDHFSYNTDLLESYKAVYPDKIKDLLFNRKEFTYFDNDHVVMDRKDKYFLIGGKVSQHKSVRVDIEKQALIESRESDKNVVRTKYGRGEIYRSTLIAKLICVIVNKSASFDAEGIGIEMEAEKPNWDDALNGLPALFGSSLSETFELKRLCGFILDNINDTNNGSLPLEIKDFMDIVNKEILDSLNTGDTFKYWNETYTVKETYRNRTKLGLSGEEVTIESGYLKDFLGNVIKRCESAVNKCLEKYKTYCTYFINEVADHESINGTSVRVKKFTQKPLPLFLEGFVHALRVDKNKKIYNMVKNSPLFDSELKMYKVNESLKNAPMEIGRAKVFTTGWLENESIWLHMEYKYMLELLKAGLYKEFFADFKNVFVPFMDPDTYKRSILENSSFIVSSANPNKENHGRGFVARMSGATAEFIDIWLWMSSGKNIFSLDKAGKLVFKLSPILPSWAFINNKYIFNLFGSIEVTYINKKGKDTFSGVSVSSYKLFLDNKEIDINGPSVPEPHARLIRDRKVKKIIVTLS